MPLKEDSQLLFELVSEKKIGEIKMAYNRFGSRREGGFNREMHKATCADCGAETEVPFKPTEGRPVYCRACFQKHRSPRGQY
jgi:CxxC-x17-CxxC domain-containing protein